MTPTTRILFELRRLMNDPKHWAQHGLAFDADGEDVEPTSARAQCWCLQGGLVKVANEVLGLTGDHRRGFAGLDGYQLHGTKPFDEAQHVLKRVVGDGAGTIVAFNDSPQTTHLDVMQALAFAVEIAIEEHG